MGIENRGHRKGLISAIDTLPIEELFEEVPVSRRNMLVHVFFL